MYRLCLCTSVEIKCLIFRPCNIFIQTYTHEFDLNYDLQERHTTEMRFHSKAKCMFDTRNETLLQHGMYIYSVFDVSCI